MERSSKSALLFNCLWLLACGLASSAWCVSASRQLSATFDEPLYVRIGLERWRTGSYDRLMKYGTMPLPIDLQTLPLYVCERWTGHTFDPEADLETLLPWARGMTLVFWWLLLVYGFLAARSLAGDWGGRLAVALLACEPNLLAHAGLATTDVALTACLVALVYHFRAGRECSWGWRVGVPLAWYGLAILAKASGLVFGPLCLLAVELERRLRNEPSLRSLLRWDFWRAFAPFSPLARDLVQIVAGGLIVVFVYVGCDWKPQPSFVEWAHALPEGTKRDVMVRVADGLCIFPNAGEGIVRQVKHNMQGHGTYLLGHSWPRAVWYYFPVALSIKTGLPLLALLAVLLVLRPRGLCTWPVAAAGVLLLFSLNARVQIGIRFFLPLLALLAVGVSIAVVLAWRATAPGRAAGLLTGATVGAVAWGIVTAALVWPHGLCHINPLWGGTVRGHRLLSDSNFDWGQGLKELAAWQQRGGVEKIDVWYFGTDPLLKRLPMRSLPLHGYPLREPEDVRARVQGRRLAVSASVLYGELSDGSAAYRTAKAFLLQQRPVARTTTFFIFDFATNLHAAGSPPASPASR